MCCTHAPLFINTAFRSAPQGVINAAPLAYIFPALCVMKLQNERLLSWKNVPCILTAIFGLLVAFIGFIMVLIEIGNGVECSHGKELPYCLSDNESEPINPTQGIMAAFTHDGFLANESFFLP